jgi:pimeloyl-ACP methyl ester carboxylesterase
MSAFGSIGYAHNGEVSIAYTVFGEGPVDLLFIGGFVNHLEIVFDLALAQRFWERMASFARVVAFDKRGMGLSDRDSGAYTLENVVDDALAVLDACAVERAAVFGVSEGGSAATMIAGTHPERVSALIQYGTYARLARADDNAEGIPVERMRRFWGRIIERWGEPASIEYFARAQREIPRSGSGGRACFGPV